MMPLPFKILFDNNGNPIDIQRIQHELSTFSKSYEKVVKIIINNSVSLDKDVLRFNVATLMPSFGMTRRGVFHRMKIEKGIPIDPKHALDECWSQFGDELKNLKKRINKNISKRSRTILELSEDSRNYVVTKASDLFDKMEWTAIQGSDIGHVGPSKILFAVFPEMALPVDNAEWDHVFRTHNYGKVLSIMINEINEWEKKSKKHLETLDSNPMITLPSVYNVMAMSARPKRTPMRSS